MKTTDWDRFVEHDPELDKRAGELIMTLAVLNQQMKTESGVVLSAMKSNHAYFLKQLIEVQIKRGVMKGPEDEHVAEQAA